MSGPHLPADFFGQSSFLLKFGQSNQRTKVIVIAVSKASSGQRQGLWPPLSFCSAPLAQCLAQRVSVSEDVLAQKTETGGRGIDHGLWFYGALGPGLIKPCQELVSCRGRKEGI